MSKSKIDYDQLLKNAAYDPTKEPPPDQIVLRIEGKNIGSFQNFITISGKQKQGKGRYIGAIVASALTREEIWGIQVRLPENKRKIALWDTEQGDWDFYKSMEAIKKLAGIDCFPENFEARCVREFDPPVILHMMQHWLNQNHDVGLFIIDGLLDLLNSYNDEVESKRLVNILKKWSKLHNMLIPAVIHQGKTTGTTIGHLGSMADRAAQSVLVIEKIKERGTHQLRADYLRSADDFTPIEICWDNSELKWVQAYYSPEMDEKVKNIRPDPPDVDISTHRMNLGRIFNSDNHQTYKDLVQNIREVYIMPDRWARQCVQYLMTEQLLFKTSTGYTNSTKVKLFIQQ